MQSYSKCFRLLTEFNLSQDDWNIALFQQSLEEFDPEILQMFLQIVAGIMHHHIFSTYIEDVRRWFQEGEVQGLNPDRTSLILNVTI
jgi:hypothetical protein